MRVPVFIFMVLLGTTARVRATPHYPSVTEAEATLASGDLDSLYLSFGAIKPGQHPDGDVPIASLLTRGAQQAARKKDWALACGFASKARQLDPKNVDACLAEADAAVVLKNRAEAEEALDAALKAAPGNWAIVLRRAKFAREEGDPGLAHDLLQRIPASAPEASPAKQELAAMDADADRAAAREALEQRPAPRSERPASTRKGSQTTTAMAPSEESIPGYAARSSEHFRITYSEGQRDFAQKAGYEQQCLDLFERAYARVQQTLGTATQHPTEVVLYTRQEFALHFGGQFGNGILGFYAGKIRMNRADTVDDSFFDTAVHEYTHAVIDSMSEGHRIPFWVHEGLARWVERSSAGNDPVDSRERRYLQRVRPLPSINQLADQSFARLQGAMVPVAYAKSALAIDQIIHSGPGLVGLERAIRTTHDGTRFEDAFGAEFGTTRLSMLDGEVARTLE